MTTTDRYQLEMIIKEGTYAHPCPTMQLYVETSIDGIVQEGDKTELVKQEGGRYVWNKTITKTFSTLEPATPTMISLSMYRKKRFQQGFKLIGTSHLSISELIPILNKSTVQGRIQLNVKKNTPSTSNFLLALNLKSVSESTPRSSPSKATQQQSAPSKVTVLNGNVEDIEAAFNVCIPTIKESITAKTVVNSIFGPLTILFLLLITAHTLSTSAQLFIYA